MTLPSDFLPKKTPSKWFSERFPKLGEIYGEAISERQTQDGEIIVDDINESFLAASLGHLGTADQPTVFVPSEGRFYAYRPAVGIYEEQREEALSSRLSQLLLECARSCAASADTRRLSFRFRDTASLKGTLSRARGLLDVAHNFFDTDLTRFIPCQNGMLRVADRQLLGFGPQYRRRNKLAVDYNPKAKCPMFLDVLMRPALEPDELDLLQRWCGLALIGVNLAQKMVVLTGTAGGGKGTFIRVLHGILGPSNVGTLRTQLLVERFEIGRLMGKTLLYGADVPQNFLNHKGASVLKALTGGDPVTLEFKGNNSRPEIVCQFNVIVTCNSRLMVRLEGDVEAWRRRLAIIEYRQAKAEKAISNLSEEILTNEAPGVLNWMLSGLDKITSDGCQRSNQSVPPRVTSKCTTLAGVV